MSSAHRIETLLKKYDAAAPRYTSYPPIPFWGEVDGSQVKNWLTGADKRLAKEPISLYVHIPFCQTRCFYCGCFVVISPNKKPADAYMETVHAEMALVRETLNMDRPVRQFHLGGGTPTFITPEAMERLVTRARELYTFEPDVEMSIEVDPRTVDAKELEHLRGLGFNRLSLGVQDFDPKVQEEVNRHQPYELVESLTLAARTLGFLSVNFDLIYGLPHQTRHTFADTLDRVVALRPGRIALYNFAFLPQVMPYQRRFVPETLPNPDEKLAIFMLAREKLTAAGYLYIGMDHFALKDDDLAVAWKNGSMRRNFMGYTTQAGTDMLAFGVSAISEFQGHFWQNEKKLNKYQEAVGQGQLPVIRGMALDPEDRMRQAVIHALFCSGGFRFDVLSKRHPLAVKEHLALELETLRPLAEDGLVALDGEGIRVTDDGQYFLRNIAVVFDNHLRAKGRPGQFSRTV